MKIYRKNVVPSVSLYVALQPIPLTVASVLKMMYRWLEEERRLGGSTVPQNLPSKGARVSCPSYTAT